MRVLVICTECAEPWKPVVPVVSRRRKSFSAALKCLLKMDQSLVLGYIWRHSRQAMSNRPVFSMMLMAQMITVGLVEAS
jgi:hypothetical protein